MAEVDTLIDLREGPEERTEYSIRCNLCEPRHGDLPEFWIHTREGVRQRVQQTVAENRESCVLFSDARYSANSPEPDKSTGSVAQSDDSAVQSPEPLSAEQLAPASFQNHDLTYGSSALSMDRNPGQPKQLPTQQETALPSHFPWTLAEDPGVPAWLAAHQPVLAARPVPHAPADTLQGARDRLTSRWFALKGIFEGATAPSEPLPASLAPHAPVLAVFSLAGGVGKTSIVATLGRALSAREERVLLVETTTYGLLPFFFGARDRRPGVLRTFRPPEASGEAQVQMVTVDADALGPETTTEDPLSTAIAECAHGSSRIIVDIATASATTARRVLHMSPIILVPVMPDMNSVVSTGSIDAFFQCNGEAPGEPAEIYYVLNQFDPSQPLHLDVREVLREQLGDRLLPFTLHRTPAVSEALAEGMTVMDYAPGSSAADDFNSLADWLKSISTPIAAPATATCRNLRWSER